MLFLHALTNSLNLYRLTCASQKWGCSKQLAYVSEVKPSPAAMDENMMKLQRANGLNVVSLHRKLRILQRLRTALCPDQSDVCILKKLRKGTWLFQVISVSLGTDGTRRNEKCLIHFFQLSGWSTHCWKKRGTAEVYWENICEVRTSRKTCLESDWLCGRFLACWPQCAAVAVISSCFGIFTPGLKLASSCIRSSFWDTAAKSKQYCPMPEANQFSRSS